MHLLARVRGTKHMHASRKGPSPTHRGHPRHQHGERDRTQEPSERNIKQKMQRFTFSLACAMYPVLADMLPLCPESGTPRTLCAAAAATGQGQPCTAHCSMPSWPCSSASEASGRFSVCWLEPCAHSLWAVERRVAMEGGSRGPSVALAVVLGPWGPGHDCNGATRSRQRAARAQGEWSSSARRTCSVEAAPSCSSDAAAFLHARASGRHPSQARDKKGEGGLLKNAS